MPLKDPIKRREYQRINLRKWRNANKEHCRAWEQAWRHANLDSVRLSSVKWRAANPDKVKAAYDRRKTTWPEKYQARSAVEVALKNGKFSVMGTSEQEAIKTWNQRKR